MKTHKYTKLIGIIFVLINLLFAVSQDAMAVSLRSPANYSQITSPSVTFSWSHPYDDKFEIKIRDNKGEIYASGKTSSKSKTVDLSKLNLTYGKTYKWYVVAYWSGHETASGDSWFTYKVNTDTTKPIIATIDVSPSSIYVGSQLSVSYKVSDSGGSGLKQVELWRATDKGGSPSGWTNVQTRTLSGDGPISGSFIDTRSADGTYWYGMHVVDNAGNWVPEPSARKVTVVKDDHGNDCKYATTIAINSNRAGNIELPKDIDYFKIPDVPSGTLTIYSTGSTDTYGFLMNSSCAEIANNTYYNNKINFRIDKSVAAGTYYVAVRHYDKNSAGSYTLNVYFTAPMPSNDRFTWPVLPDATKGKYGTCSEWGTNDPKGCYWISDWRDVQPFQGHYYITEEKKILGYHLGADYNHGSGDSDLNMKVYPAAAGTVSKVASGVSGYGNIVFVKHSTSFGVYTSMYSHVNWLDSGKPTEGASVTPSKPIALIGKGISSTGSYPAHLHFEIRRGDNRVPGPAYSKPNKCNGDDSNSNNCPQNQVDPNAFISIHK